MRMKCRAAILAFVLAILLPACEREASERSSATMPPDITGVVEEADHAGWQVLVRTENGRRLWLSVEDAEIVTMLRETELITSQLALEPGVRIDAWLRDLASSNPPGADGGAALARRVLVAYQADHR